MLWWLNRDILLNYSVYKIDNYVQAKIIDAVLSGIMMKIVFAKQR